MLSCANSSEPLEGRRQDGREGEGGRGQAIFSLERPIRRLVHAWSLAQTSSGILRSGVGPRPRGPTHCAGPQKEPKGLHAFLFPYHEFNLTDLRQLLLYPVKKRGKNRCFCWCSDTTLPLLCCFRRPSSVRYLKKGYNYFSLT